MPDGHDHAETLTTTPQHEASMRAARKKLTELDYRLLSLIEQAEQIARPFLIHEDEGVRASARQSMARCAAGRAYLDTVLP